MPYTIYQDEDITIDRSGDEFNHPIDRAIDLTKTNDDEEVADYVDE